MRRAIPSQSAVGASQTPAAGASWGALLSYGFRPLFLLAAGWAALTLLTLVRALVLGAWPAGALPLARSHGHEMLFGFGAGTIAGTGSPLSVIWRLRRWSPGTRWKIVGHLSGVASILYERFFAGWTGSSR